MAFRHTSITFGLVNIPVMITPLIKNNDASFNQLHKKCLNRIKYIKYCSHCKKEVTENEIIKGYKYEPDKYITFDKNEINKLKPQNDKEIEIISFIDIKEIDPSYFEKSYILDTEKSSKSFTLFYEALKKTKKVALAKTVISSKFYYAILRIHKTNIIMTTLYFKEEINFKEKVKESKVSDKELDLAIRLINEMVGVFEPNKYYDEYQTNIQKAINNKLNGKSIKNSKKKTNKQVSDLLDALEKSLKKK